MAFTKATFNNVSSGAANSMRVWSYTNTSDSIATMTASNYFSEMRLSLSLNDMIYVNASDGNAQLRVTSARYASPTTTALFSGAGSVDTADIADGAVTEAKLNASVAGDGLAGGGGSALSVNVDDSTIETNADTLRVKDDGITLAKMAAGTAGNIITYDASGNPAAVATGTSGHVLTSNGAGAEPTFQSVACPVLKTRTVGLTPIHVAAMYSTPYEIIPPGVLGTDAVPFIVNVTISIAYGTAAYTGGGDIIFQFDNTANGLGPQAAETISATALTGISAYSSVSATGISNVVYTNADIAKQGLYLSNKTAAFAAGGTTVLTVFVTYRELTINVL